MLSGADTWDYIVLRYTLKAILCVWSPLVGGRSPLCVWSPLVGSRSCRFLVVSIRVSSGVPSMILMASFDTLWSFEVVRVCQGLEARLQPVPKSIAL